MLGSNCVSMIIAFILRLFKENENEAPLPSHDWTLVISGIIVHKFMISLQCWLNWFWKWKSLHLPHSTPLLNHLSIYSEFELSHPERPFQSHLFIILSGVSSKYIQRCISQCDLHCSSTYFSCYMNAKSYHRSLVNWKQGKGNFELFITIQR